MIREKKNWVVAKKLRVIIGIKLKKQHGVHPVSFSVHIKVGCCLALSAVGVGAYFPANCRHAGKYVWSNAITKFFGRNE